MIKYLITIPLLLVLIIYLIVNIKIDNQVKTILNDFNSASECNYVSTNKFADGDITDTEYLFYRCVLSPDIKTLYFYVDKENKKIVKKIVIPTNYESIVGSSPRLCTTGVSKTDKKTYMMYVVYLLFTKRL